MATALVEKNLISGVLPQDKASRLAVQFGLALAGTLLLTISAKTRLVLGPVDMSMQTLAVMMIGASFGLRLGVATVLLYLAEGAAGLPVFQGTPEKGIGLLYMMGTTGGYLAGFVAMVAITGFAADRGWGSSIVKFGAALVVAEVVMLAMGAGWLAVLLGAEKAWAFGVGPFIIADAVKVAIAALAVPLLWRAKA